MRLPVEHGSALSGQVAVTLAGAGSAAVLLAAWGFQVFGGLAPCPLCVWQRWPHVVAVVIAACVWRLPAALRQPLLWTGAAAAVTTGLIGVYHTGIERGWWPGPDSCSGAGSDLSALSGADLLDMSAPVNLVMCDEVAWSILGLSMASWNAVAAFAFGALWILGARRSV